MLEMFEASLFPKNRRSLLWQECWNGASRSCQWGPFGVDIACLRNVLFTGKTLSPSVNWESIHGCRERCPLGEMSPRSLAPPQTRGMWAASWWGLWGLCHFHTSRCRMTPFSPTAEHSHYSPCYDRKYSSAFGKDYSCSLLGKFSVIRRFQTLNLTPEIVWSLRALFSTTAWCDPHLAESCELKLIYTTWSLNMQTIIFSLKNTKTIYLKLPVLDGSLILLKIPSSTFKPTEGKNINNLLIAPAGPWVS